MTERTFKRLVGGLAVLLGIYLVALLIGYATRPRAQLGGSFGEMIRRIRTDTITRVIAVVPGGDSLLLQRAGGGWNANGAPADSAKVNLLLRTISTAQTGDLVSRSAAALTRLGAVNGTAWRVEIDGLRDSARFLLATGGSEGGLGYARLPDQPELFTISAALRALLTDPPRTWLEKRNAK